MATKNLLVIDDDPLIIAGMKTMMDGYGVAVEGALTPFDGIRILEAHPEKFPVIVLDYRFPDYSGDRVTESIKRVSPQSIVLIYSGDENRESVRRSFKSGAADFIQKDIDPQGMITAIIEAFERHSQKNSRVSVYANHSVKKDAADLGLTGSSAGIQKVAKDILCYQKYRKNVLIFGETGTGKERVARAIHGKSKEPFIAVNCAGFNNDTNLMESELFGYERGAFTGANSLKEGLFLAAGHGSLFLDELHELSLTAQAKLLRVIQERKIRRVGGVGEIPFHCRIIAAAKPDLQDRLDSGRFMADLYTRLYELPISIPSLRDRIEDVYELSLHFLDKFNEEFQREKVFLQSGIDLLKKHHWPGNVRELENTILRLIITTEHAEISADDVRRELPSLRSTEADSISSRSGLKERIEAHEKTIILEALMNMNFNYRQSAKVLEIPESTLRSKLKKLNLDFGRSIGLNQRAL